MSDRFLAYLDRVTEVYTVVAYCKFNKLECSMLRDSRAYRAASTSLEMIIPQTGVLYNQVESTKYPDYIACIIELCDGTER